MFRDRILPAVLTAAGVTMIGAGLLSYTSTATAGNIGASTVPEVVTAPPGSDDPILSTLPTLPPVDASPSTSPSDPPKSDRVATRVVVEALDIDLPIVRPRGSATAYPQC